MSNRDLLLYQSTTDDYLHSMKGGLFERRKSRVNSLNVAVYRISSNKCRSCNSRNQQDGEKANDLVHECCITFISTFNTSQLEWRLIDRPIAENENEALKDLEIRRKTKCTIFFSYTSNMISSGIRETIRFLVQNKLVSAPGWIIEHGLLTRY